MIRTRIVSAATALMLLAVPLQAQTTSVPPAVLSQQDVALYRQIFAAERSADFATAKELVTQLSDTSLVGYAQAEHYLSPRGGKTPVEDLVAWLQEYRELSIADRIYDLAVKRSTKKVKHHHKITLVAVVTNIPVPPAFKYRGGGYEDASIPDPPVSSEAARSAQSQIDAAIKVDQPDQALGVLQSLEAMGSVPSYDLARLALRISSSYIAEGMDAQALALSERYAVNNHVSVPLLDWCAGFSAYRRADYDNAAGHLERLAQKGTVPNWIRSQAAFWAARAHMQAGDPLRVITLLSAAAREEPTFYGLLAERLLGLDARAGFSDPVLTQSGLSALMQEPHAHRAVALWQVGEHSQIPEEMNRAFAGIDTRLDPEFAYLAKAFNLPNLELRASETSARRGKLLTGLFPVPSYQPTGGYTVDPSLVLAFARAESHFRENAVSPAGARGLMQIMPGTAHVLGGDASLLGDPTYSLTLGNRFIAMLLDKTNNNLFQLAAAYNAGPGSLQRWLAARDGKRDDPLMFIESIPVSETRNYIKRILTYHWMYRRVLGRTAPTLDETASGDWPIYHASDARIPSQVSPRQPNATPAVSSAPVSLP